MPLLPRSGVVRGRSYLSRSSRSAYRSLRDLGVDVQAMEMDDAA